MFINKLDDLPVASNNQIIIINSDADPSIKMPACRLTFHKDIDDKGLQYIKQGFVEIVDRSNESCKEYPLPEQETYFYYNTEKQICSILSKEGEGTTENGQEIIDFLNLTKDEEVIQSYRFLTYYWALLSVGMSLVTGSMTDLFTDDDETFNNKLDDMS